MKRKGLRMPPKPVEFIDQGHSTPLNVSQLTFDGLRVSGSLCDPEGLSGIITYRSDFDEKDRIRKTHELFW